MLLILLIIVAILTLVITFLGFQGRSSIIGGLGLLAFILTVVALLVAHPIA